MPTARVLAYMRASVNPHSNKRFPAFKAWPPAHRERLGLFAILYADPHAGGRLG